MQGIRIATSILLVHTRQPDASSDPLNGDSAGACGGTVCSFSNSGSAIVGVPSSRASTRELNPLQPAISLAPCCSFPLRQSCAARRLFVGSQDSSLAASATPQSLRADHSLTSV